jgi:hypothetical protein
MVQSFFVAFALFSVLTPINAQTSITIRPGESIAGTSQADWSKAWWQWAGSFGQMDSPIADMSGKNCHLKQSGPVWFLAGTYGTQRTVRTCTVPRDKYVFFPLINYVVMPSSSASTSCASFARTAKEITDQPSVLILELDGRRVEDLATYRQVTRECFDMGALANPKYRIFPSAANGYYAMLRPLSPGRHVLNFGGVLPGLSQAVTYTLLVE